MGTTAIPAPVERLAAAIRDALPAGTPWWMRLAAERPAVELSCGRPPPGAVVVAAVTDDPYAEETVACASQRAGALSLPLRLVHVWTGARREADGVRLRPDLLPHADLLLSCAAYDVLSPDEAAHAERQLLHDTDPATALRAISREAAVLVVGAAGEWANPARPLGSTTRALIGRTACPLVVVQLAAGPLTW